MKVFNLCTNSSKMVAELRIIELEVCPSFIQQQNANIFDKFHTVCETPCAYFVLQIAVITECSRDCMKRWRMHRNCDG